MKVIVGLYVTLVAMFLVNLTNITLFSGEWNGIAMWISTGLFIAGTACFSTGKAAIRKNEK